MLIIRNFEQSLSSAVTMDAYRISFHKMNSERRKINCDGKKLYCAPNRFCGESLNGAVRTRNGVMDNITFHITGKNDAQACYSVVRKTFSLVTEFQIAQTQLHASPHWSKGHLVHFKSQIRDSTTCRVGLDTETNTYVRTRTHTHTRARLRTCMHTHAHAHTYIRVFSILNSIITNWGTEKASHWIMGLRL